MQKARYILGIAAGKGGVGKSTISVNLAWGLQKLGYAVGILDADIYGPSLGMLLSAEIAPRQCPEDKRSIIPAVGSGIKMLSLSHFRQEGEALAVRAPIANSVILQFLKDVKWGDLDYLLIDFPPGTGDVQLTLLQEGCLNAALIVTTPQEVALLDVRRAMNMFEQMKTPILGIVENMSCFIDPAGVHHYPLGKGGGKRLSEEWKLPLLGEVPLDGSLAECCDQGKSIYACYPQSAAAQALEQVVLQVRDFLDHLGNSEGKEISTPRVFLENKATLGIEWADGLISKYSLSELQKRCPCTRCQENPREIEGEVHALCFKNVGRYAIQIDFTTGCSKGVYPFQLLRQMAKYPRP